VIVQRSNGKDGLGIGERDGRFALRVMDITGNAELAAIGEAKDRSGGAVVANDNKGTIRLLMSGSGQLHLIGCRRPRARYGRFDWRPVHS